MGNIYIIKFIKYTLNIALYLIINHIYEMSTYMSWYVIKKSELMRTGE